MITDVVLLRTYDGENFKVKELFRERRTRSA
jgi:hypothetical protein